EQVTNFNVKIRILPESYQDLAKDQANLTSPFKPGLSATVDIHTQSDRGLSVPIQAVTTRETAISAGSDTTARGSIEECVFVYKEGRVYQINVSTGIQDDKYIRVLTGLTEGQEVVVSPFTAISKTLTDSAMVEKVSKELLF